MDMNGNGYMSLAEVDKGMRDVVKLPALFELKPVLMRAFQAAKNKVKTGGAGYAKDPYVPTYKTGLSVAGPVTYQPQPKMYGGADAAIAGSDTADYSGNLK